MHGGYKPVDEMSEAEAAAELLARHLDSMGTVLDVGFEGSKVSFTTEGDGVHLGNISGDYVADVHLVCEPGGIASGPLVGNISDDATVYANIHVHGLEMEPEGYALPTHIPTKDGAVPRNDMTPRLLTIATKFNIPLEAL